MPLRPECEALRAPFNHSEGSPICRTHWRERRHLAETEGFEPF